MSRPEPSAHPAPRPPVDQAARELAVRDVSRSYCVEAGAGTGKTSVLIGRLLTLIEGGHAKMSEIAAITFTEKAAAELKLRLRQELERRGLERALHELDQAAISTIHAFAAALLRERPVEAGVDPGFEPIDELEDSLLFDEFWARWLAEQLDGAPRAGAVVLARALRLGLTLEHVRGVAKVLADNPDLHPGAAASPPRIDDFLQSLALAARELEPLSEQCVDREDAGFAEVMRVLDAAARVRGFDRDRGEEFLVREFKVAAKGNKQRWRPREACDRQKEICKRLGEELEALQGAVKAHAVYELVAWLREFVVALGQEREARGVLNFTDLLVKARAMLQGNREARGYFQRRFKFILVDEFQDTDPLQVEIAFLLAEAEPRAEQWDEAEVVPGKLFIVGDPKQSIYRFRRADIETYDAARNRLAQSGGGLLAISQNFRTVPAVVEWANGVFGGLIKRPDDGNYQPDYEPLHSYREPIGRPSIIVLPPPPEADLAAMPVGDARALEGATIAALIERIVGEGWPVFDKQAGGLRPARYGDVALLFPRRTGLDLFEEALQARGIPYRTEGGKQFYQRQEIVSLVQLLTAIDNPYDAVAVVAALRSPLFGCSDQDLYDWHRVGGTFYYLDPRPPVPPVPVGDALAKLAELHALRNTASIPQVVEAALAATRAVEVALLDGNPRAAANLAKVVEQARSLGQTGGMVFRRFARWLAERYHEATEEADSPALEADAQAVQLLTVHKSKGLEFPIVVLANANSERRGEEDFLVNRQRGTFELRIGRKDSGFCSPGYDAALPQEQKRQVAEDRRLFYVAATRARDYLIIPEFYGNQRKGFLLYLQEAAAEEAFRYPTDTLATPPRGDAVEGATPPADGERADVVAAPVDPTTEDADAATAYLAARDRWEHERQATVASAGAGLSLRKPSALHEGLPDRSGGWDDAAWTDEPGPGAEDEAWVGGPGGGGQAAAFGSAFHAAMQRLDLARVRPGDTAVIAAAARVAALGEGVEPRAGELAGLIAATLQLPPLQRAQRAKRVQQEVPFCVGTPEGLMEGRIDLLVEGADGYLIVDFKTDRVEGAALDERFELYRPQGEAYAQAVAAVTAPGPIEVAFVFVRAGVVRVV